VRRLTEDLFVYEDSTPPGEPKVDEPAVSLKMDEDGPPSSRQTDLPMVQLTDLSPNWQADRAILCLSGRAHFDEATIRMFVQLLEKHGLKAGLDGDSALFSNIVRLSRPDVELICLSSLDIGHSPAHLRGSIRRVRRQIPEAKVLAGLWGHDKHAAGAREVQASVGADLYVYSLREAVGVCIEATRSSKGMDPLNALVPRPSTR